MDVFEPLKSLKKESVCDSGLCIWLAHTNLNGNILMHLKSSVIFPKAGSVPVSAQRHIAILSIGESHSSLLATILSDFMLLYPYLANELWPN